eukprot:TRINITY_DN32317_c0_g1_i1.p1 TRINITY_DN32317_c0_g1~~TRINITY_DN32317_c0_g1_i1.p1  ORF type:complete len:639 (+),score=310.50 TRINITY_DN32317_c0_g1_i1:49-1965(+)
MPRKQPPIDLTVSLEGQDDTLVTLEGAVAQTHLGALKKICAALKLGDHEHYELVGADGALHPTEAKWDREVTAIDVRKKWVYVAAAKLEAKGISAQEAADLVFNEAQDEKTVALMVDANLAPKTCVIDLAECGYWTAALRYVKAGADVNAANRFGRTAVMIAVQKGYHSVVRELGKAGADVTLVPEVAPWVALIAATTDGDLQMVKELIDAGADLNQRNICGFSALMEAAWNGRLEIVTTLLAAGADVNAKANNGWTALIGTASVKFPAEKDEAMLKCLLDAGADPNHNAGAEMNEGAPGTSALRRLAVGGGSDGTALQRACVGNWVNAVKMLLAAGADMSVYDSQKRTALRLAACANHHEVVQALLEHGADPSQEDAMGNDVLAAARAMKKKPRQAIALLEGSTGEAPVADTPIGKEAKRASKHADPSSPSHLADVPKDLGPIEVGSQVKVSGMGPAYEGRLAMVLEKVIRKKKVAGYEVMVLKDSARKTAKPEQVEKVEAYASVAVAIRESGALAVVDAGISRKRNPQAEEKSVAKNFGFDTVDGKYIRSQHARYNDLFCYYDVSDRDGDTNPVLGDPFCGTVILLREQPPKFAGEEPLPFVKLISVDEVHDFLKYKEGGRAACLNGREGADSDDE